VKCPYCGAELESPDQRFCQFCGAEVPDKIKSQSKPEKQQPTSIPTTSTQQSTYQPPTIPTNSSQTSGVSSTTPSQPFSQPDYGKPSTAQAHSYAKKCLAYAIVSIALSIFAFAFGGALNFIGFIQSMNYYYSSSIFQAFGPFPFLLIIPVAANVVGLIFGITSRKYKSRSESLGYTDDTVRKVGSTFAIFGIILNAVGMAVGGVFLFNNFSSLYYEYMYGY